MKKLMVLAIAAVSVMSLHAQQFSDFFSTEKSSDKIVYGVRFGLNVMGMRNNIAVIYIMMYSIMLPLA